MAGLEITILIAITAVLIVARYRSQSGSSTQEEK